MSNARNESANEQDVLTSPTPDESSSVSDSFSTTWTSSTRSSTAGYSSPTGSYAPSLVSSSSSSPASTDAAYVSEGSQISEDERSDCESAGRLPLKVGPPLESQSLDGSEEPVNSLRLYAKNTVINFKHRNGTSASYKADLRVRVRTIGLIGALLPGIGCYLCIIYSYLFQFENVSNFTSTTCEDLHSPFPPVSFSIGVWKPQKYFWLVILTIHFPPRLLFGYVYKSQYRLGESEYRTRSWFPKMIRLQIRVMFLEAVGLIVLSIFDMETYFGIHAVAFALWLISFNFNMLFNCILHYHSGIRDLTIAHKNIFYVKCTIFMIAYPFSWSTAFTYFSYVAFCSGLAFALFAIAEYVLIGCNCLFYFLLVWELTGSRLEFFVTHKNCTTRTELDVI